MTYAELEPLELVSCGGASLNLMGWVSRSTSDVDIICPVRVDADGRVSLQTDRPLPPRFFELVGDLLELGPTEAEARAAVAWLFSRKTSAAFRRKLREVLDRISHENLAQELQD